MAEITRITFDGIILTLYDAQGSVVAHSFGMSGVAGSQAPSLQSIRNIGPIPEGSYSILPSNIDYRDDLLEELSWSNGWGNGRVTLIPNPGNELYGRGGFFLHGSLNDNGYGSHGCIDLNQDDLRILTLIETQGAESIDLVVDYSQTREFLEHNDHPLLGRVDECFLAGTPVLLADNTEIPIERVRVGDMVQSYDRAGRLVPARVVATTVNRVRIVLDLFGLMMTPGHVTLCGDGPFAGQHVPVIDILRSDGAVVLADGSLIRAATGARVGSGADRMIWAMTGQAGQDGFCVTSARQIRAGTRILLADGRDFAVDEIVAANGGRITEAGLVANSAGVEAPFVWTFGPELPRPEDYVLARSAVTLADIHAAAEWEDIGPRLPAPPPGGLADLGPALPPTPGLSAAVRPNLPHALRADPEGGPRRFGERS